MNGLVIQLKNVDFMQKMSCSLPSLEAIHVPRLMRGFMQNTVMRHADYPYPVKNYVASCAWAKISMWDIIIFSWNNGNM